MSDQYRRGDPEMRALVLIAIIVGLLVAVTILLFIVLE